MINNAVEVPDKDDEFHQHLQTAITNHAKSEKLRKGKLSAIAWFVGDKHTEALNKQFKSRRGVIIVEHENGQIPFGFSVRWGNDYYAINILGRRIKVAGSDYFT